MSSAEPMDFDSKCINREPREQPQSSPSCSVVMSTHLDSDPSELLRVHSEGNPIAGSRVVFNVDVDSNFPSEQKVSEMIDKSTQELFSIRCPATFLSRKDHGLETYVTRECIDLVSGEEACPEVSPNRECLSSAHSTATMPSQPSSSKLAITQRQKSFLDQEIFHRGVLHDIPTTDVCMIEDDIISDRRDVSCTLDENVFFDDYVRDPAEKYCLPSYISLMSLTEFEYESSFNVEVPGISSDREKAFGYFKDTRCCNLSSYQIPGASTMENEASQVGKSESKRKVGRATAHARRKTAAITSCMTNQHLMSDQEILRLKPKKERRRARFDSPVASRYCHICGRCNEDKSKPNLNLVTCRYIKEGTCRKVVCLRCFTEYNLGNFDAAMDTKTSMWECPHCTGNCPRRAQCRTYQRVNDRLRLKRLKDPTSIKKKTPKNTSGDGKGWSAPSKQKSAHQ